MPRAIAVNARHALGRDAAAASSAPHRPARRAARRTPPSGPARVAAGPPTRGGRLRPRQPRLVRRLGAPRRRRRRHRPARGRLRPARLRRDDRAARLRAHVAGYAAFLDAALGDLGIERVHLVLHDFGGPIGLAWAAIHVDALASVTLIDTGILPGYKWHRLARIWRTPVLGEIFQATATRRAFRFLLDRNEPRGLPRAFVDRCTTTTTAAPSARCSKLYRATDDPGAAVPESLVAASRARPPGAGDLGRAGRLPAVRLRRAPARGVPLGRGPRAARQRPLAVRRRAGEVERLLLDFLQRDEPRAAETG